MVKKRDRMKDNKGQALVEFALILPIFLLIVFIMIDFGKIIYNKITLQNDLSLIVDLYNQDKIDDINNYIGNNDIEIEYKQDNIFLTVSVTKQIELITPGLNNVLSNPYSVKESMTIVNE